MNWFLAHGDKLLLGITGLLGTLSQVGVGHLSPWFTGVTALAALLHTVVLPEPTPPPAK